MINARSGMEKAM